MAATLALASATDALSRDSMAGRPHAANVPQTAQPISVRARERVQVIPGRLGRDGSWVLVRPRLIVFPEHEEIKRAFPLVYLSISCSPTAIALTSGHSGKSFTHTAQAGARSLARRNTAGHICIEWGLDDYPVWKLEGHLHVIVLPRNAHSSDYEHIVHVKRCRSG